MFNSQFASLLGCFLTRSIALSLGMLATSIRVFIVSSEGFYFQETKLLFQFLSFKYFFLIYLSLSFILMSVCEPENQCGTLSLSHTSQTQNSQEAHTYLTPLIRRLHSEQLSLHSSRLLFILLSILDLNYDYFSIIFQFSYSSASYCRLLTYQQCLLLICSRAFAMDQLYSLVLLLSFPLSCSASAPPSCLSINNQSVPSSVRKCQNYPLVLRYWSMPGCLQQLTAQQLRLEMPKLF